MVWDRGTYDLADGAGSNWPEARSKVLLHGEKLRGGFVPIHGGGRSTSPSQAKRWLSIKHRDEEIAAGR